MKHEYDVIAAVGYDENGIAKHDIVKSFKHENNAVSFYTDPKTTRKYHGNVWLYRSDADGRQFVFDDEYQSWKERV